jgi:cell pole-organizing protein PopZ
MLMTKAVEFLEGGDHRGHLISREVNNAVHAAFNALAQTVLINNSRTLDDLVREMLQPILTVWINDNLPNIVERLVRLEIEQISPRPRVAGATSLSTDRQTS